MLNSWQIFPKHLPHHFLLGIGSNIEPYKNVARALEELLLLSNIFAISPIAQTEPISIQSKQKFLNLVIYFPSNLQVYELKESLNIIEEKLGRDRDDPLRKVKDHPIDFDIIAEITNDFDWLEVVEKSEIYYRPPMLALFQALKILPQSITPSFEVGLIDFTNTKVGQKPMLIEKSDSGAVLLT